MKIVICGTLVPAEYENRIAQLSNAANRFLMNFVKELKRENEVEVYSYLGIDVDAAVRSELHGSADGITYFYKTSDRATGVLKYGKAVSKALKSADCLMTYNVVYAWMFAPALAKWIGKRSVLILADYSPMESYGGRLRRMYAKYQMRIMKKYDVVIGLSENSRDFLDGDQKFVCIEGGIDQNVYDYFEESAEHISHSAQVIRFMYAGILEPVTGIDRLLLAFSQIKNANVRLSISGKGSLETRIRAAAKADSRIEYLGCVPYEEYLSNLKKADVLINPRNMDLPENANNFPSKIMEYLATGKPVISTRFPGWEKFTGYITFCDSSVECIQSAIESFDCEKHDSRRNREFAADFIWKNQVEKIMMELNVD